MLTLRELIDWNAAKEPDKTFLFAPESQLQMTYGQLRTACLFFAREVGRMGLRRGDKVSFMMGNGFQTARIFLGAMYSGLVIAPLNLHAQPAQLKYVLQHSDTKLVFVTKFQHERLLEALDGIERDVRTAVIDKDAPAIFPEEDLRREPSGIELQETDPDDAALLLYTSGTTGNPKGAILTHKNMLASGRISAASHELLPEDRGLVSLPLFHINAETVSVMGCLVSGSSIVLPERFSVTNFWELLSLYRCTWFSVVPTIISYLVSGTEIEGKGYHLEQVRFGRSASAPLPPTLHKEFEDKFKISIVETMGLTETGAPVFSNPMDPARRKYGTPGLPVINLAKIIDKEGNELPTGERGEIMIKGENVMKEYYKDPEKTQQAIDSDGWFHTGDLGYKDEDGFIFVTGRIKEIIIKGGENIAPREIDECFYCHPAILDAAACGIPDEHYGEEIMVCYTLKPGCSCTEDELREHALKHLGKYKTPKTIICVEELPKGPSGKIQRLKLPEMVRTCTGPANKGE
jgi:long-chain acyl-CoA synthetase